MTSSRAFGLGLFALVALACRPREGERCICAGDCAGDLVCAADGAELRGNQCVYNVSNDIESGVCVEGGNAQSDDDALTPPPKFDLGSWATSGQIPITTAATTSESEGETTTMPEEDTSSSGDATSSTTSGGTGEASSSSSATTMDTGSDSDGTGATSGAATSGAATGGM